MLSLGLLVLVGLNELGDRDDRQIRDRDVKYRSKKSRVFGDLGTADAPPCDTGTTLKGVSELACLR